MKRINIPLLILVTFIIAGCQSTTPTNVVVTIPPTMEFTATSIPPTETPEPTATSLPPTATTAPTPTIVPPEILSKYLTGIQFISVSDFESAPMDIDYNSDLVSISNGEMLMKGVDYQGGMNLRSTFNEGEGVIFDMRIIPETPAKPFEFETYLDHGTWWTDTYRRFGMYLNSSPEADLWMGKVGTGKYLSGNLTIKPDVNYRVALAVGQNADFLGLIWNPQKPDANRYFHQPMGEKWGNNEWLFVINGAKGSMAIDNVMTFKFDGFNK